jgi:hypothetical protein
MVVVRCVVDVPQISNQCGFETPVAEIRGVFLFGVGVVPVAGLHVLVRVLNEFLDERWAIRRIGFDRFK